jgi:hypothetical protein
MAGLDTDPLPFKPSPQDGQARCRLCATSDPRAEHDWCRAVSGLVCQDCCHRVLLGDLGRLMAITYGGGDVELGLGACAECERGQRWFAHQVLGVVTRGALPS